MAFNSREEEGASCSADALKSSKLDLTEGAPEWRSWEQLEASPPSTSPAWNSEEDEDSGSFVPGTRPSDLYGKSTWKIENFSQISKRELRSNMFEVGGYKWYILVYPQGCDVCNHLSLFLCVADYDKLLPGWSHFVQFTIAVVNKDPKKFKYSDTLHRFCKKEHDWGWKKFMELSKVPEGFTVADTLVIKAQVQVIRENPHRPFRCLDCQYRRELVRVYMTNVEGICRRFVEEKREKIGKLMEDPLRWPSFRAFWTTSEENVRQRLSRDKTEIILKAIVKAFFNEKEVTSTLVMDALYSGCKALDYGSKNRKGKINGVEMEEARNPVIRVDKDFFVLAGDVLLLLERASKEFLPSYKDEKGPQSRTKEEVSGEEFGKDTMERDERRLTELGRRTVEMFVLAHMFSNRIEVAYLEAIALKRQEELIREEEAAGQAEIELKARREAAEKEKRNKKKQAKQRRTNRKERDKDGEEKQPAGRESRQEEGLASSRAALKFTKETSVMITTTDLVDDDDDSSVLDNTDGIVGTLRAAQDGDADQFFWERERSELNQIMEASFSGGSCIDSSENRPSCLKQEAVLDDSSSTCSSDSIPSNRAISLVSDRRRSNTLDQNPASSNRVRGKIGSERDVRFGETKGVFRSRAGGSEASSSNSLGGLDADTVIASLKKRVQWLQQRLLEKEEEVVQLHEQLSLYQHHYGSDLSKEDGNKNANKEADCNLSQAGSDSVPVSPARESKKSSRHEGISSEESHNMLPWVPKDALPCSDAVPLPPDALANGNFKEAHPVSHSNVPSISVSTSPKLSATPRNLAASSRPPSSISNSCETLENAPVYGLTDNSITCSTSQSSLSPTPITDSGMPRPSSAPGLPEVPGSHRPPSHQSHAPPPLVRSVSATGRLGAISGDSTLSSTMPYLHAVPSYRNAAAGMIQSNTAAGSSPYSDTSLQGRVLYTHASSNESYVGSQALAGLRDQSGSASSTLQRNLSLGNGATSRSAKTKKEAKMQSFGKMSSGDEAEKVGGMERTVMVANLPNHGRRSGMGLTFGTVTPEVLHLQHQHQRLAEGNDNIPSEANYPTREHDGFLKSFRELPHDSDKELRTFIQQQVPGAGHSSSLPQRGLSSGQLLGKDGQKARQWRAETSTPFGVTSEEFPHLDIINELLDDDKMLGAKALNAFLQQPVAMHELRRVYGGQVGPDMNSVLHDTTECTDGVFSQDNGSIPHYPDSVESMLRNLGEGNQLLHPYPTSSLQCSLSHPSGELVDAISGHHWQQGHHGDMPATSANGLDVFMGYPMPPSPHLPVVDYPPPYAMGQNGYPMYSPMKHP